MISTCIWLLVSLLLQKYDHSAHHDCNSISGENKNGYKICKNNTQPSSQDDQNSGDFHEAIVIESSQSKKATKLLTHFEKMDGTFTLIVIICLSIAIAASLTQFICSAVIMFSPSYVSYSNSFIH